LDRIDRVAALRDIEELRLQLRALNLTTRKDQATIRLTSATGEGLGSGVAPFKNPCGVAISSKAEDHLAEGCQEGKAVNFSSLDESNVTTCLSIANKT
jgi:hypothetical protein